MVLLLPQHTETPVLWRVAAYLHEDCRAALAWQRALPSVCCCCSVTKSCPTLCDPMDCSTPPPLSSTISRGLLKVMVIESMMLSNHLILCRPLLLSLSFFTSIRVFSNVSTLHIRWPKYRTFSFSISPSNEYSGFVSFRIDWVDLLAVQGILKSLLQHHNLKVSILRCSAFFMIHFSHPYMTSGKPYLWLWKWKWKWKWSRSVVSDSLQPHGL